MKLLLSLTLLAMMALSPNLSATEPVRGGRKDVALSDLPKAGALEGPAATFTGFRADPYLAAAIRLQAAGKEKGVATLADLAEVKDPREQEKVIILSRMLFVAKPKGEFRYPGLGRPFFIAEISAKDSASELKDWPLEPIELVDGVPFCIVRGYGILGGRPETAKEYLDYCVRNCDWNTQAFKPKTAEEKRKTLAKLLASPKWEQPLEARAKEVLSSQIE